MKQLTGHTSPETAYVVDDYPYGFKLRCKIRYWVETKKGFGQRFMSQTTNPKKAGEVWNKPKGSTYSMVVVMVLDDVGHVQHQDLTAYGSPERVQSFKDYCLDPYQTASVRVCERIDAVLAEQREARAARAASTAS